METNRDPLQATLAVFEEGGWSVDYSSYSMIRYAMISIPESGGNYQISHACQLQPAKKLIRFSVVAHGQSAFDVRSTPFLQYFKRELEDCLTTLSWEGSSLTLTYTVPALLSSVRHGDLSLGEFIGGCIGADEVVISSCLGVLGWYGQFQEGEELPKQLTPHNLTCFCRQLGHNS